MGARKTVVLDLARNLAGPYAAMILGDLGADVIKIEPRNGDESRYWMPTWNGEGSNFLYFNRNKRSIALDLKSPAGREIVFRLAEKADVAIESFRPGVMEAMGLGYEDFKKVRPDIVYCSVSGFGRSGPDATRAGFDPVAQSYVGLLSVIGLEGAPPVRAHIGAIDLPTGLWAVIAIQGALFQRQVTGLGQHVDVSLLGTGLQFTSTYLAQYFITGKLPKRQGSTAAISAPYEAFATADDHLMIACGNQSLWARLCKAIGRPDLTDDPRFATNEVRVKNRDTLHEIIETILKTKPAAHWEELLVEVGMPCSIINSVAQAIEQPQVKALNMIVDVPHPKIPDLRMVACPIGFSEYEVRYDPPPLLGQHTEDIMREAGYTEREVENLRRDGVI